MAMGYSKADAQLLKDPRLTVHLPAEFKETILNSSGVDYLNALASASLLYRCTDNLFTIYQALTAEITARWIQPDRMRTLADEVNVLSCLARIFPFARYLRPRILSLLRHNQLWSVLYGNYSSSLQNDDVSTAVLLLAIFRILSTEPARFRDAIKPTFLSSFLSHGSLPVRYLAVQCLCIVMRFADAMSENLVVKYAGSGTIQGHWEGRQIDYRLLKLHEETRWKQLEQEFNLARGDVVDILSVDGARQFSDGDLSSITANIGGALIPRDHELEASQTSFVRTSTSSRNLGRVGETLLHQKPILVTGITGSGKTALITESARLLNKQKSMITLHLNEQTDAKSLLGVYTSSASSYAFEWQPGVLTKAVRQGRWVLIEDIDRAPAEVLGVLRPIIEDGELFLPNRKEHVKPAEGFRVLATITSSSKTASPVQNRHAWLTNSRLWSIVHVESYHGDEIKDLLDIRYPQITPLTPMIMEAHQTVCTAYKDESAFRAVQGRLPSLRDLLKWCRRVCQRLRPLKIDITQMSMPESFKLDIFKDAIDCYAAFHNDLDIYQAISERIAQAMSITPQQMTHTLNTSVSRPMDSNSQVVVVGRSTLQRVQNRQKIPPKAPMFAMTNLARRTMESIAAGASCSEPLLLVGETGVGKTTIVQHVANLVNQKLTVVNLSQQSEATDLLGGLKPVTTRSLIVPLVDQFNTLFDDTFSNKRNEKFQVAISKAIMRQNWQRLVLLWQEAVQMAEKSLNKPVEASSNDEGQLVKRRRITSRYQALRERWADFTNKLAQIRVQLERGDKNHTFAFVEGRLVQAVRGGEWLLLDEINLASADTLDHIVGLLRNGEDERPSLLLTEAGDIEQITAHPGFRIFAAMNPATDTGKKDLAPGIRSRFTEIYVSAGDTDIDDLVKIIQTYLGSALSSDKRAAVDLARAYLELKKLNIQHKLTDGAGDAPHFSIRSLVRCLMYVMQHNPSHGLRRSMHEGFAMSFFTVLSRDSENLALPLLNAHLLSGVRNPRSFLSQQPKIPVDGNEYVAFRHHVVLRGSISPDLQTHYIRTPSVERNLLNLARAASMRRFPILLQGPTSAGKTSMVEYLAKLSGNRFVRINNHEHTDLQEYLGSYATGDDGRLEFREGVLVEALRKGHWIVLDELNLAPSDVLEALNRLLDDNRELLIPESQEVVRPHSNFMLFATQNPAGLYGGRKRLSRAFRNRFLELHFDDIPEDELEVILRERAQIAPSFCTQIVQVYKKLSLQRQSTRLFEQRNSFATLRDLFRWAARPVDDRQQLAEHGFMLLGERVRDAAERKIVKTTIEETMKVKLAEQLMYSPTVVPVSLRSSESVVWTPAMTRLFVLVSNALRNNEPVLLVGETGCGKTQICQTVAHAFETNLSIYNAHSNTETGDLIGSQRPIRQRTDLASEVLDNFKQLTATNSQGHSFFDKDIDELIEGFDRMDTSTMDPDAIERTRKSIAAYQSLFAWKDGSLVRSMKLGEHFLLDEISLADDSVLERLNSVLEPARTILLAEKGPIDSHVIAHSNFQFLATMNPGGDYGKRELSAALRNRLTEIWVPPLSQEDDILPILQAKLGSGSAQISSAMLKFAMWFQESMQNSATSTIPLRSLLAWAGFMNQNRSLGPEAAFVHGAAMVYIDSLGANPAGLTSMSTGSVDEARGLCLDKLRSITQIDAFAIYHAIPTLLLTQDQLSIGDFSLERTKTRKDVSDLVFEATTTVKNTMRIVRALQMYRPILLEGSPGVGKTAIVTALAAVIGKPLTRINLSDQTDLMDLFGADAPSDGEKLGRFSWRDGPLLQAMQSGGWVLLDEMNLASQSVLEGLNSCLDHRHEVYVAELDTTFTCHPDFTLFAAQNPHHQGGGRKGLPASFVNRFTVVYADSFQREDLMRICRSKRSPETATRLESVIDTISSGHDLISRAPAFSPGSPWELNLRDVNRWLDLCEKYPTLPSEHHFDAIISQRFRSVKARDQILSLCESFQKDRIEPSLYHNLDAAVFQLGTSFLKRDLVMQHVESGQSIKVSHLPYAKTIIVGLEQRWPILLVGASGSGKTSIVRSLATLRGAKLIEFSMNADVDTMDLIGGFEQRDALRDILITQKSVCEAILGLICVAIRDRQEANTLSLLFRTFERCCTVGINASQLMSAIEELYPHYPSVFDFKEQLELIIEGSKTAGPRFVWNDGILIDALQEGSWLVLDNANLCNPSVLDRLNSLLEPDGSLAVTEQHTSGHKERIIKPHIGFRIFLTMDPKYGELSRAMRNRSLELFVDSAGEHSVTSLAPQYPASSNISRIRWSLLDSLRTLPPNSPSSVESHLEILSRSDINQLLSDTQMSSDLEFQDAGEIPCLQSWSSVSKDTTAHVEQYYKSLFQETGISASGVSPQTQSQLPIMNDALLRLSDKRSNHVTAMSRKILYELDYFHIKQKLDTTKLKATTLKKNEMSLLQLSSTLQNHSSTQKHRAALPAYQFLTTIVRAIPMTSWNVSSNLRSDITTLTQELMEYFAHRTLDPGVLQAYLQIVQDLIKEASHKKSGSLPILKEALAVFGDQHKLQNGISLQRMWPSWKPDTASTWSQLESQIDMENLVLRFDQLAKCLPQRRSELSLIRSRLLRSTTSAKFGPQPDNTVQVLSQAIEALDSQGVQRKPQGGLFTPVFNWLLHVLTLHGHLEVDEDFQLLSLFAQNTSFLRPTKFDLPIVRSLKVTAFMNQSHALDSNQSFLTTKAVGLDIVSYAAQAVRQPLSSLDYVEEEVQELTATLAKHVVSHRTTSLSAMTELTLTLVHGLLASHQDILTPKARQCVQKIEDIYQLGDMSGSEVIISVQDNVHQVQKIYDSHVRPALRQIRSLNTITTFNLGAALVNITVAALKLFVPDRTFDPANYPILVRKLHTRTAESLRIKIASHTRFQEHFTGQKSSTLIRMYEDDVHQLGDAPHEPAIVRPTKSGLEQVQEVFSNVIRGVLQNSQAMRMISQINEVESPSKQAISGVEDLQRAISQLIDRFSSISRAYDDIAKPVEWLMESLSLGLGMLVAQEESTERTRQLGGLSRIPLLGASPFQMTTLALSRNEVHQRGRLGIFEDLEHFKFVNLVERKLKGLQAAIVTQFLILVDHLYTEWKVRLAKGQAEAEVRSRYYAYRGEDDAAEEMDNEDMANLFPTFDTEDKPSEPEKQQEYDHRATAIRLAALHETLLATDESSDVLQDYVAQSLKGYAEKTGGRSVDATSLTALLPGVFLRLEQSLEELSVNKVGMAINIYTDTNIVEVRKLLGIVNDVQSRFLTIAQNWPEHAVPSDVLNFCNEVLAFQINEPIAKLLTKTEKLLEIIAQWQSVASREWSVASLMDKLTSLIISWRRLELSSWSRLLDTEFHKAKEDANAWYFITYEAVIENSRLVVEQSGNINSYCQELAKTMEEFLRTTPIGQFSSRLNLLQVFLQTLTSIAVDKPQLTTIVTCLSSVINHYRRYESHVQETLSVGRIELEKDIKEQIQLASWKDTNVTSLRDSARRTHYKLFKIVKKYRALLAQPMTAFRAVDTKHDVPLVTNAHIIEVQANEQHLRQAMEECARSLNDWNSRPDRLIDPLGAIVSIRKVYNQVKDPNVAGDLASFREDIVSTAKELRKQTPQTLTKDNASLVRHLRGRKRRLLADTMKALTHMGIRRNLGTSDLNNQNSLSVVLAISADHVHSSKSNMIDAANTAFHEILDVMPGARSVLREHSDDLSDGEIARGLGLLEGLLFTAISQRNRLTTATIDLQQLSIQIEILRNLQDTSSINHIVISAVKETDREEWLSKCATWLPKLLSLASHILGFQAQSAGLDYGLLVSSLRDFASRFADIADRLAVQVRLPPGLSSQKRVQDFEDCETTIAALRSSLEEWQRREPRIEYMLQQLIPWTERHAHGPAHTNGVVVSKVGEIDGTCRTTLDQIFVAIQRISAIRGSLSISIDDPGWLMTNDKVFEDVIKTFHINDIAVLIRFVLSQLQHLPLEDLPLALSILTIATPVIEQYETIIKHIYEQQLIAHIETCRIGVVLSKSFVLLANEGFCTPAEPSKGEDQSGKLESGTGLGEGEGAEDISKDIGDDEDLSELAQTGDQKDKDDDQMENSKDAVDMGADELEGEMGSGDEKGSDDEDAESQSGSEHEQQMDEETGSVDELDPSAVDEKMWDDIRNDVEEEKNEMKGDKKEGKKMDEQTAKDDTTQSDGDRDDEEMDQEPEGEVTDTDDENEGQGRPEAENVDPHLENDEALEIPEDIQFDGDDGKEEEISDDGMDKLSDIEEPRGPEPEQVDQLSEHDAEEQKEPADQSEAEDDNIGNEDLEEGKAEADEIMEDQVQEDEDKQEDFNTMDDNTLHDVDADDGGDTGTANQRDDRVDLSQDQTTHGQNHSENLADEQKTQSGQASEKQQTGDAASGSVERGAGREDKTSQRQDEALKNLADILEQFHQRREILTASEERKANDLDQDIDMADADFEHMGDEEDRNDAQALGAAAADQAQHLDQSKAVEDHDANMDQDLPMPEDQDIQETTDQQETIAERFSRLQAQPRQLNEVGSETLATNNNTKLQQPKLLMESEVLEEDMDDAKDLEINHNQPDTSPPTSVSDASTLWAHCSTRTHALSLLLTEQLRLILAPTTATKLRGDFRTGKRLNIKRIIPYIASGYKRDKIWMRRSVPSKRNYQIMIAVDDSKSMSESGADILAFETLAMLCKSLSMLEVGELCVISFGEEEHIRVAHPFGQPFTSTESGPQVFRNFSFAQRGTDVRKLVRESISIFQDARLRSSGQTPDDLWQLQLIVSDGHCSDHDTVRRLVRAAHEQKIMIVFIVVDAGQDSIIDLKEAVFERVDPLDDRSEMKVKTKRYLEGFPFQYYVVVRDVSDLPGVLARVLKGWFEGVVDVQ